MKIHRMIILVLFAIPLISGCFTYTRGLFKDTKYKESISSILITQDRKNLVVISEKYHYVFDMPYSLPEILNASFRTKITATFDAFRVDKNGKTSGRFYLRFKSASDLEHKEAVQLGMHEFCCNSGDFFLRSSIAGQRYDSGGLLPVTNEQKLNNTYQVYVYERQSNASVASKMLLTPVTLIADGVLAIAAIPLVLIPPIGIFWVTDMDSPERGTGIKP